MRIVLEVIRFVILVEGEYLCFKVLVKVLGLRFFGWVGDMYYFNIFDLVEVIFFNFLCMV